MISALFNTVDSLVSAWPGFTSGQLLIAGLSVSVGYFVYGLTGFGSSIVAIPVLTQVIALRTATPVMLILDLAAGVLVGMRGIRLVSTSELRRLMPWLVIGLLSGVFVLVAAPEGPLKLLLGGTLLIYSTWRLVSRQSFGTIRPAWSVPLGLAGGCLTAIFGTGGPLYTIYLAGRLSNADQRRATISTLITITALLRLLLFSASGLYQNPEVPVLVLCLLPCGAIGLGLGTWFRGRVSPTRLLKTLWLVLLVSGITLFARTALNLFL
ncbi:Sulfite exporter TauE/SafE [Caballeronia arvi]|uniref:Probable membrane transporter protein n=1 Tax=Caballeronia arvi TaxID=1777135 RepID=A0A158K970_9BURK|nr:sulfite exporter TauE/SafE family protein [Caballeronia arvi]SAL77662.1 Sulfite exporter TauE/SafE [Caballeronia arvi]